MNLENTMLSERKQTQKATCYIIPFICEMPRTGKSIDTESRPVVARDSEKVGEEWGG